MDSTKTIEDAHLEHDPLREDFRNFVGMCFEALGNTAAPLQYDVAYYLQHGPAENKGRIMVSALRNFGKSYLTAMYAAWRLYCDPDIKITCISGNAGRAVEFMRLVRRLISTIPELNHLNPSPDDRDGALKFDCGARKNKAAKDASLSAYGIGSMITGIHVDVIIADDVETPHNSETVEAKEKLFTLCLEFEAIINPGGTIVYLGTPQSRNSIYNRLKEHYTLIKWPARYPDPQDEKKIKNLAPLLLEHLLTGKVKCGDPTYIERFPDSVLIEQEAIMGPTVFGLQMLLDTELADEARYPLKLRDFIVMPVHAFIAPETVAWGTNPIDQIENYGLSNDYFNSPIFYAKTFVDYEHSIMFVDPGGGGVDETGYAVAKVAKGMIYIPVVGGLMGGHTDQNLVKLAEVAKLHNVKCIVVEKNFGDGAWGKLLLPVISKLCPFVGMKSLPSGNKQKEKRILDILEPLIKNHRVVIDKSVAMDRVLMMQVSNITRDRNSLKGYKDDRIEALAGACAEFIGMICLDPVKAQEEARQANATQAQKEFVESWERSMGRMVAAGYVNGQSPIPRVKKRNWLSK